MEGDKQSSSFSSPLFWSQSQKAPFFTSPPPPSPSPSGIRAWLLVLLFSIFFILFIPSFISSNTCSYRPSLMKNGWNSLNLVLVVFAILFGLLARDVASGSSAGEYKEGEKMSVVQSIYEENQMAGSRRMRRSSSSYPDLRQEFDAGEKWSLTDNWRFYDDNQIYLRRRSDLGEISGDLMVKTIQVDTLELTKSPLKSPLMKKITHSPPKITQRVPPSPPPPPPPPPPPRVFEEQKKKSYKKRSGAAAKDIATALALFYSKKKRSSKAKKIHDDDSVLIPSPPPPPPPPPLQSSVFSQLFSGKKGGIKNKRFSSISDHRAPPPPPPPPRAPPPPPPPPPNKEKSIFSYPPRKKRERKPTFVNAYPIAPLSPLPPPPAPPPPPPLPPNKEKSIFSNPPRKKREKKPTFVNPYPIAPLSPLPPPPPPPPPLSPTCDEIKASVFCPSPDVNNKADVFIKRFHDGLKLEKLHSMREKQQRRENQMQDRRQQEDGIEMEMEQQIMAMMMGLDDKGN